MVVIQSSSGCLYGSAKICVSVEDDARVNDGVREDVAPERRTHMGQAVDGAHSALHDFFGSARGHVVLLFENGGGDVLFGLEMKVDGANRDSGGRADSADRGIAIADRDEAVGCSGDDFATGVLSSRLHGTFPVLGGSRYFGGRSVSRGVNATVPYLNTVVMFGFLQSCQEALGSC